MLASLLSQTQTKPLLRAGDGYREHSRSTSKRRSKRPGNTLNWPGRGMRVWRRVVARVDSLLELEAALNTTLRLTFVLLCDVLVILAHIRCPLRLVG